MIHMVLCTRRGARCGVVFLLSHDLSEVGSRSLWSRSWQTLCAADLGRCAACATGARAESCREAGRGCASVTDPGGSATLVQASGDSTGGRAQIEHIVDVPVPQILEQSVEVIKVILQE